MNASLVFAELVVIGLQVLTWLGLLFATLFPDALKILTNLHEWDALVTAIVLAGAYSAGTIFDRLCDSVFGSWNQRLKDAVLPPQRVPLTIMRYTAALGNDDLNRLFEYTRSRMRIARATAVNGPLVVIAAVLFVTVGPAGLSIGPRGRLIAFIVGSGGGITGAAIFGWQRFMRTYLELVKKHYDAKTAACRPSTGMPGNSAGVVEPSTRASPQGGAA